ncbi:MAG: hypothetical protein HY847_16545 [Betaproteobacteria bacterium]|nr:hypothetical protein [Betaproteobacteria bacterium]
MTKPPQVLASKSALKPAVTQKSKTSHVSKPEKASTVAKAKKVQLIRYKFTMPETEHALIRGLKKRCLAMGVTARKSYLIRAAVLCLADLEDRAVLTALKRPAQIKTRKPAKREK